MTKVTSGKRPYRMARRAAAAQRTAEAILTAASQLWLEHPYDAITLQRVADTAGVSLQTVLVHYGNKEGLTLAVFEWHAPREEMLREVPPGDVERAVRVLCGRYEELGPATLRLLALEERLPSVREPLERARQHHRAWVERVFADAIRAAGRKPARLRLTMALVSAMDLYTWHVLRRVLDPEQTALTMIETVRVMTQATSTPPSNERPTRVGSQRRPARTRAVSASPTPW